MVITKSQREDMRNCEENEMCNECVECSASVCLMSCEKEIDFYNKYSKLINELETKAAKFDMIQWAVNEEVQFIQCVYTDNNFNEEELLLDRIDGRDLKRLEQLYKEREQE